MMEVRHFQNGICKALPTAPKVARLLSGENAGQLHPGLLLSLDPRPLGAGFFLPMAALTVSLP